MKPETTGRKATALPQAKATKPLRVTTSTHPRKKNSSENGLKFKQWSNKAMKSLVKTPALKQTGGGGGSKTIFLESDTESILF